jgi:hypothetical protein
MKVWTFVGVLAVASVSLAHEPVRAFLTSPWAEARAAKVGKIADAPPVAEQPNDCQVTYLQPGQRLGTVPGGGDWLASPGMVMVGVPKDDALCPPPPGYRVGVWPASKEFPAGHAMRCGNHLVCVPDAPVK